MSRQLLSHRPELTPWPELTESSLMQWSWHTPESSAAMCIGLVSRNFLHGGAQTQNAAVLLQIKKCGSRERFEVHSSAAYLLVLLSSSSHRSSATRKTDLSLMGREMEWTLASSTSSTSSWLLHMGVNRSRKSGCTASVQLHYALASSAF